MEQIKATGRRKSAIARVFLSLGTGKITINKRDYKVHIPVPHIQEQITLPINIINQPQVVVPVVEGEEGETVVPQVIIETPPTFDIKVNVKGGGIKGQAEAIKLGIARALVDYNPDYKPLLKAQDIMTRDSRVVERKKPGLRKARKRSQFSKR